MHLGATSVPWEGYRCCLITDEFSGRSGRLLLTKKRSERRKHCALAVVRRSRKFSPRRRPPSRGRRTAKNLISWRWSLPLPTNPVWWRSMHAISSYRSNRPTSTQTQPQTHTGPIKIHCTADSAQCNNVNVDTVAVIVQWMVSWLCYCADMLNRLYCRQFVD